MIVTKITTKPIILPIIAGIRVYEDKFGILGIRLGKDQSVLS
jgi:hypothetical protein